MRDFYLYRRNKKSKIYYAQLLNPKTGKLMPGKSTGEIDRDRAVYVAMDWLENGFIPSKGILREKETVFSIDEILYKLNKTNLIEIDVEMILSILSDKGFIVDTETGKKEDNGKGKNQSLIKYLSNFWDYEKSPYLKNKNSHRKKKKQISKEYVLNMGRFITKYWKPYFGDLLLKDLTNENLEEFGIHLINIKKVDQKGKQLNDCLSTSSINHIIKAGTVALNYAKKKKIIKNNPVDELKPFEGKKEDQERGILTEEEVQELFAKGDWSGNPGNKIFNILCMQTGLRLSEGQGLQYQDIGEDRLYIKHSWNDLEGLKSTKSGKERTIPLLKETRKMLIEYAEKNPHGITLESFIFWNINTPKRPQGKKSLSTSFNKAVDSIGISRTDRLLVLHSWRHFYSHTMDIVMGNKAMQYTGHATESVYKNYANHEDEKEFQKAIKATNKVFGNILQFKQDINKEAI